MRFQRVRSGLAETIHDAAVVAIDSNGSVVMASGDVDRPVFYRSAIKPFQALAVRRFGVDLPAEHLAVTCSSHGGYPAHLTIVHTILDRHGFTTADLRTPPAWPLSPRARDVVVARGYLRPLPEFHNCSGKHAGFLAACSVAGLDAASYDEPDHPLQRSIAGIVSEFAGTGIDPVGVDGCGTPTLRGTVTALGRAFSRLTTDPELTPIAGAMATYGALVADNVRGDGRFAVNWGGPAKIGAEGLFATSLHGVGIAAKAADGNAAVAVAAVIEAADRLGMLPSGTRAWLDDVRHEPVLGGGVHVGRLELVDAP